MKNLRRYALVPLLALLALPMVSRAGDGQGGAHLEAIVDVPREHRIPLDFTHEKAAIVGVESQNEPKDSDVKEASERDPKDKTAVVLRFFYTNPDYVKRRAEIRAVLLGENGAVLGEGGRRGTLDARREKEDTISFPMRVKTLNWPRAEKLKVLVTFLD